ncbi:MAG: PilN domain-containing protein [Desulfuromonadaceae bacterium]|nr:PilN domain-containing protein [Desulfuromonadaceae bacterium]
MRFTINFATRIYLDHRLLNRVAFCIITALIAITGWNIIRVASNVGEQSRLNAEIAAIQSRLETMPRGISETESNRQKASIRFYNEIIERKSINWLNLLERLENATPEGCSLSSLSQGKDQGEWNLAGRARSFKVVEQFLEKLESSDNFSNVLLLSHQNLTSDDKVRGIQFTISCNVVNL